MLPRLALFCFFSILLFKPAGYTQTARDTIQSVIGYSNIIQKASKKMQERDLDSALYFANQAKKHAEERLGKKTYDLYAQSIFFTSMVYQLAFNYESAMNATIEYLQITSENKGKKNTDYLQGLMGLSNLYFIMNNYGKAEETLKEAMPLCILLKGKESREYIRLLKILSQIYAALQNDDKAQEYEKEALMIETKLAGNNSDEKKNLLSDLARIYKNEKDFKKADSLYTIILAAAEKQSGNNSYAYAMALENLGGVYKDAGDLEKAKRYHLQAAKILKNNKSTQVDYAASLMDLGDIYLLDKNYMLAENAYLEAERIVQEVAGKETLTYQVALTRLLHLYRQWDNSEKTALYTVLQIENWHQRWIRSFATFTESDKAKSLESETGYLDYAFSVLYDNNTASKSLIPVLFTVNNDIDGLLLQNNSRITQFVSAKKDTTLSALYNSWINYKKQYANALQVSSGEKQNQVIKELETKISQNEKQLLRYDPALEKILRFNSFSYRDIVNRLKPGEALVKWVNFNYHNSQNFTDSIFYGAFIVLAGKAEPLFVKVCEQKQLKEILRLYYNSGDRGAGEDDAELLPVKRDSLHFNLYNLLWEPLLPLMGNTKTIYNIPSGQIHRISFAALQDEKGRPVFDIYQVHQLLSVRDMINSTAKNTNRSALLFGGVDFSIQEAVSTRSNNNPVQKIPGTYNPTRGGFSS